MSTIKLKVLSWNLHAGIDWYGRFLPEKTLACIREWRPDLCGFQEVDRNWGPRSRYCDLAQMLAEKLEMEAFFSPSLQQKSGSYGNLILSRYPFVNSCYQLLPDSQEQRSFCYVQIINGEIQLGFLTTHLGLTEEDRCRQVEQIQRFVNSLPGPLIISGDFNATPEEQAVQMLTTKFCDLQSDSKMNEMGTFRLADGRIGPRIDYLLSSEEFTIERFQVISNYCSDHLPLLATVCLTRPVFPVFYQ
ncbi:MAG: endonuclease/exonuclease/phosphatase family protein [Bacillota bacterium]|jgi:endonuclease/exonuclease/phosphatase family metal-dependent hydrolase